MQYINNNSDFALDIALKAILPDGAELATAPPNCDFTLTFGTRYDEAKYEVGRYNGEPHGYTVNTDGSLHVIFDAHGLGLGRLGCMLTYGIPDSSYPDGVATVATSYELDVELIGWGADGQQSGTVTIATEAAAVGAAQQAQAAAERAAQAAEASQQAAQSAEAAAQASANESQASANAAKASESAAQAAAASSAASQQAAEQAAEQAQQARAEAGAAAESAAQASTAAQASESAAQAAASASAESATAAQNSAESAAAAVTAAQQAIDTANTAAEQATTAAQAANTAADSASEYVERYDAIAGALPKVTDTFEGAYDNKGLLYVVRKNKLIAILKDWQVIYVPEGGIALVDAIAPTSFSIGDKVYNVPAGITYVELGLTAPITGNDMYRKVLYKNAGIRGFGLYLDGSKNTSLGSTFELAADLEWLDISGMDTKAVTFGIGICNKSTKLRKIYGKWQLPNVELASNAFISCQALEEVDVSEAGMDKCRDLGAMFRGCSSLTALDVSGWNTAACTTMGGMFYGCSSLTSLDVSGWNTAACTNMSYMFNGCSSLTALDVSGWDFSKCTSLYRFAFNCKSLSGLKLGGGINPMLIDIRGMFSRCNLKSLDVNDFDVSSVVKMGGAFSSLSNITEIIIPKWNTQSAEDVSELFGYCTKLQKVDISGFIMSNVTTCGIMFYMCDSLHTLFFPNMGQLKADVTNNKTISFSRSPLGTAGEESLKAFKEMFTIDRYNDLGYTEPLTVILSTVSKSLLTPEEIAAITAKGYTIA